MSPSTRALASRLGASERSVSRILAQAFSVAWEEPDPARALRLLVARYTLRELSRPDRRAAKPDARIPRFSDCGRFARPPASWSPG